MSLFINQFCRIRNDEVHSISGKLFDLEKGNIGAQSLNLYELLKLDYPKFFKMDFLSKFGFLASEVIFNTNPIEGSAKESMSVVLANASGSLDVDQRYFDTISSFPSPSLFVYTLPNIVIGEICIRNQFKGENAFFVQEGFDANWMSDYVEGLMSNPDLSNCLAGWVEVLDEHYDVFLSLIQKKQNAGGLMHSEQTLKDLYTA